MSEPGRTSMEGARILVVDVDAGQRENVLALMRHAGHEALAVDDGERALDLARRVRPDLVLLDTGITGLDSIELCRRLKADPALHHAFVVHVGGGDPVRPPVPALEAGSDGFIPRPLPDRELLARVEAMLRIQRAESALRRLQARQSLRLGVTRILTHARSLEEAALPLLRAVAEGAGWPYAELWTEKPGTDRLVRSGVWHAGESALEAFAGAGGEPFVTREQGLAGSAWGSGEVVWAPDLTARHGSARAESALRHGLRGGAAFPLRRARGVTGAVVLLARDPLRADPDLVLTLGDLGAQIGHFLDRVEAEDGLRFQRNLFRAMIESIPDGIALKDLDGRYLMVNAGTERMLRRSAAEIVGRLDADLLPPEALEMARRLEQQAMRDGVSGTAERAVDTPDGRRVFVMRKTVCRDPDGRIIGTIAVSHDVTQQRAVEERMRMAQRVEAMGRLAGGVAHDFNNLLTIITVNSDLALQGADPESPTTRAFEEIRDAADRASELTRQLLAYGRRQHLNPRTLDLNELLARLHPMLRRLIPENIAVRVVPAGGLDPVTVDPVQLEQVVLNLAANARDAMSGGGHLTIETRMVEVESGRHPHAPPMPPGRYVRLAVTDDGTGMDEATRARIFEPFFTTKALGHGTGLGLAMVYGTVKQSGGWIWVDSEPGRGATFEVLLPSAVSPLAAREPGPSHGPMPRGTETVLLVEDDTVVRDIACRVLERCGYRVLLARDGGHAIAIVSRTEQPIALVVTDVVMPHMSGPELAARLRALRPGLRFLFVSGYADQGALPSAVAGEPREFLQKPFTPESLARRVREALDAAGPDAGAPGAAGA